MEVVRGVKVPTGQWIDDMTRSKHQNIVPYVLHVGVLNGESEAPQALDWQDKNAQENAVYNLFSLCEIPLCPFINGAFFVWLTSIHDDLQG